MSPTARWTAQQVVEAFPFDTAPRFLIRDRDGIYGQDFRERVKHMGLDEVVIAYRSPWQSPYVERLIGSIRRECLDHVIVFNEAHLLRILHNYFAYYHELRTHLSLDRNAPLPREVEPPERGNVVAIPRVGGYITAARALLDGVVPPAASKSRLMELRDRKSPCAAVAMDTLAARSPRQGRLSRIACRIAGPGAIARDGADGILGNHTLPASLDSPPP